MLQNKLKKGGIVSTLSVFLIFSNILVVLCHKNMQKIVKHLVGDAHDRWSVKTEHFLPSFLLFFSICFFLFYRLDDGSENQQMQFYWKKTFKKRGNIWTIYMLDILFRQITTFIKVHVVLVFGLQTL